MATAEFSKFAGILSAKGALVLSSFTFCELRKKKMQRSYTEYFVIIFNGKESEKEHI